MSEQLVVLLSEIILATLAIAGIVIVIAAAWYDLRVIRRHKRRKSIDYHITPSRTDINDVVSIRTMPNIFKQLTADMIDKALHWRRSERAEILDPPGIHKQLVRPHQIATTILIATSIGLIAIISLMTYFFYTAAILQSNTLLTLSWAMVSLWLVAVIWSDNTVSTSVKYALTFAVPFMYFVLYVVSFARLAVNVRQLLARMKPSRVWMQRISAAIQFELYSTRY